MKIPSDNKWTQLNQGDIFGVLNGTRNITLDHAGKLQLSKKAFAHFTSNTNANFSDVVSILYYNSKYIIVTSDESFEYNLASNNITEISGTPIMSQDGDALIFNSLLYMMGAQQLNHWDGTTWTSNVLSSGLTSGNPHPMAIFDSNPTYKLAIADGNKVYTYDNSHGINSTVLTIPSQFEITTIVYRNGYLYVGTRNLNGEEARVFIWSGNGASAQYEVPMGGEWVFAMTPYSSTVACVVDTGEVVLIKGSSRQMLGAFPIFYNPNRRWTSTTKRIAHRGMFSVRDSIYINIDGSVVGEPVNGMKSGMWTYNPESGLTHTANIAVDELVTDAGLSLSSSVLTTSATHNLVTGDSVMFQTTSGITGIDSGVIYYVYVVSSTEIKLALSLASLEDSNFLTLGGTPGGLDKLIYVPNTDYGKNDITYPGAIGRIVSSDPLNANQTSDVFFSGRTSDGSGTTVYTLCGLTNSYNIGSFTTQRIYSDNISQVWKEIYAFVDGLDTTVEEVIIKHRTEKAQSKPTTTLSGTWGSSSTIHSNENKFDEDDWNNINIGDEVFIKDGYGQGQSAHITDITTSANTYVLTIDETFGNTGSSLSFIADNWTKTGVHGYDRETKEYTHNNIDENERGAWVQFKFELRGFEPKVSHLELINSVHKNTN